MEILGFILSVACLLIILFFRNKIEKKNCKFVGILFLISIPTYFILLLFIKYIGIRPDKKITIAILVSVWILSLMVIFSYLSEQLVKLLIDYQIKIGNQDKKIIKSAIRYQSYIVGLYQFSIGIGLALSLYGLWLAPTN